MRWRIDPEKPFTREIRSIADKLIIAAEHDLAHSETDAHIAVHEARKKFKRIRALYLLVQPDARQFRKQENARFRGVAQSLSVARDAAALVETVAWMSETVRTPAEAEALAFAHNALAERRDRIVTDDTGLQEAIDRAMEQCAAGRQALEGLDLPDGTNASGKRVASVWSRQQKKARQALDLCRSDAHVEHFHDLRKCSQIRRLHLGLLRDLWPCAMRSMQSNAKQLVDLLGHEHDLSVLAGFADAEPELFGNSDKLSLLLGAIIDRKQASRKESLSLAEAVFNGTPDHEARLVSLLWRHAG